MNVMELCNNLSNVFEKKKKEFRSNATRSRLIEFQDIEIISRISFTLRFCNTCVNKEE